MSLHRPRKALGWRDAESKMGVSLEATLNLILGAPMWWLIGLLFLLSVEPVQADETPVPEDLQRRQAASQAYEQAIVRFNTNIQGFDSWAAFKAAVFSRLEPNASGHCFELTGSSIEPITITAATFQEASDGEWQETPDNGWRKRNKDRTFIEYRVNVKEGVLLQMEGVNPRFFFASTRRMCEFPLLSSPHSDRSS
jgi:hypothetical protein